MKYLRIFLLYFQHVFQHRARSFIWFLIAFLNPFVLMMFWGGALKGGRVINGWDLTSMRTYYLLVIIVQSVLVNHVENTVGNEDILQGELVRELLKPIDYLWLKLSNETPWRLIQGMYGILILGVFFLFGMTFTITSQMVTIFQAICVIVIAFALGFLFKMILGVLAFWMTDISGVLETNDVLILLFSGIILPFDLLPTWIQKIALFTPYPYIVYYPVVALMGRVNFNFSQVIVQELVWVAALFALYRLLWAQGVKRFSGVGQ